MEMSMIEVRKALSSRLGSQKVDAEAVEETPPAEHQGAGRRRKLRRGAAGYVSCAIHGAVVAQLDVL